MSRPWLMFVLALLALAGGFLLGRSQADTEEPTENGSAAIEVVVDATELW